MFNWLRDQNVKNIMLIKHHQKDQIILTNKMSNNESSFLQYLSLFWPVWQSGAAVEEVCVKEWATSNVH